MDMSEIKPRKRVRKPAGAPLVTAVSAEELAPIEAAFRELAEAAAANFPGRPRMVAFQLNKGLYRAATDCLSSYDDKEYPEPDELHDRLRSAMTATVDALEEAFGVHTDARGRECDTERRDALFLKFARDIIAGLVRSWPAHTPVD
jgi:hypothetical protein